jgi:two-component system LytT family response regulator
MSASLLRVYLVDDEPLALKRLSHLLQASRRVEILGKATDPETALDFLRSESVDVLLLDIQMPGTNGFELLAKLPSQPMVIFTTAYDEYALKAFKVNSIDYLLKPIEPKELERALDKVERLRRTDSAARLQTQLQNALEQLAIALQTRPTEFPQRIASRVGGRIQFIDLTKISHFQSEEKLTYAVTPIKEYVVDHTITELEHKLDPKRFVRIHRSTLLNLSWVDEVHSWFGGRLLVRLKGEKHSELTVARDRARTLKQSLGL